MSARLISAASKQVEPAIEAALEDVRAFIRADRVFFLQVSADETAANVSHGRTPRHCPPFRAT